MKKILVVDDEKPISDIIKFNMAKEGGLMIHTKIVYQDLDVEALNKANDEKKVRA